MAYFNYALHTTTLTLIYTNARHLIRQKSVPSKICHHRYHRTHLYAPADRLRFSECKKTLLITFLSCSTRFLEHARGRCPGRENVCHFLRCNLVLLFSGNSVKNIKLKYDYHPSTTSIFTDLKVSLRMVWPLDRVIQIANE